MAKAITDKQRWYANAHLELIRDEFCARANTLVGVDLSTNGTGVYKKTGFGENAWTLKQSSLKPKGERLSFLVDEFYNMFLGLIEDDNRVILFYEALVAGGGRSIQFSGLVGCAQAHAAFMIALHKIGKEAPGTVLAIPVNITTIKKLMTGSGRATKEEMIEAVRNYSECSIDPEDDNQADAISAALGVAALYEKWVEDALLPEEEEVLIRIMGDANITKETDNALFRRLGRELKRSGA